MNKLTLKAFVRNGFECNRHKAERVMKMKILLILVCAWSLSSRAQTLYYPPLTGNQWDTLSLASQGWCPDKVDSLYSFLDSRNTKAFVLLVDGKIVLERYFGSHTANSLWYWASAGKTLTSFLVGLAQEDQSLNISDTTSQYLGIGWTSCTPQDEMKITIRHQLSMSSGLSDLVPDPFCTLASCLTCLANPGTRWAYHNAPYTLLDGVMESATGTTLNQYANQRLKNPTGMTGFFLQVGYNNVYWSNARSMARFGLLMLGGGRWNGQSIMADTAYFNDMVNTSQSMNESYGYLWWLNGKNSFMLPESQLVLNGWLFPDAPADMYAAMGADGQFLNVVPSKNMVWLRMGESPDSTAVPFLLNNEIWQYINVLGCNSTVAETEEWEIRLFPNPATTHVEVNSDKKEVMLVVRDVLGKEMMKTESYAKSHSIHVEAWPKGVYTVEVTESSAGKTYLKLVVE